MSGPTEEKRDCYSAGERKLMQWSQQLREYCLRPLLVSLAACRIQPDHITLMSVLVGLAFCPLYFYSKGAALAVLVLHVLLDGLDGPLARFTNVASPRGSFTDSLADQTVVVATTITVMTAPEHAISVVAGSGYIFVYTLVVVFAMVRNAMQIPYSWVVRPRFVVYIWLIVELYWLPTTLNAVIWICNCVLTWKVLTGFWKIRNRMS